MKSPWKFLVRLASRGSVAEESASTREIDTDKPNAPSPTPIQPDDVAPQPIDSVEAESSEVGSDLGAVTVETAVIEVDRGKDASTTTVDRTKARTQVLQAERTHPPQPKPVKRQTRTRKTSVGNVAVVAAVKHVDGSSGVALPPMTFIDEVAALDEEINQLRRQLAEKLFLQNAQLKKMLERFDAS